MSMQARLGMKRSPEGVRLCFGEKLDVLRDSAGDDDGDDDCDMIQGVSLSIMVV